MVFHLYATEVVNSRRQTKRNEIWRRRKDPKTGQVFTTRETPDLSQIKVTGGEKPTNKFNPAKLFLSVNRACDHLDDGAEAAWHLHQTVIDKMVEQLNSPTIDRSVLTSITRDTLRKFDKLAAEKYLSYRS